MTVITVIAILATMLLPTFDLIRKHADKAKCSNNLRNLYVAANSYVQQNMHWPQIDTTLIQDKPADFAKAWIAALQPFGIDRVNWICPTVQSELNNPDLSTINHQRRTAGRINRGLPSAEPFTKVAI
jgi:type II secretory pathway pseudopilin PulG